MSQVGTDQHSADTGDACALRIRGWMTASGEWATAGDKAHTSQARAMLNPRQIPVTPEMIEGGQNAGHRSRCNGDPGWGSVTMIYRAMAALDPERATTLTIALDAGLVEERDAARMCVASLENRVAELESCNHQTAVFVDRVIESNCTLGANNERLRDEIAALTAEKNALHDALAKLTEVERKPVPLGNKPHASDCAVHGGPAFPSGPCTCGAMHNPFRAFPSDPRRIGG